MTIVGRHLAVGLAGVLLAAACQGPAATTTPTGTAAATGTPGATTTATAAAPSPTATGTSSPGALTKVRLQLQWLTQAQFAGYFAARDKGFYAQEGLEVEIIEGGVDIVPQSVVAAGQAEFGVSWLPKVLASIEQGADLVNIAQPFQRSATTQISWADTGIDTAEDWRGKTVSTWGAGNEHELFAAMRKVNIDPENSTDVTIVTQDFTMDAFINRDVDAAQAMTYNEYAQVLEKSNPDTGELYQPEDISVITMESTGTAMLQDGLFASNAWLAQPGNEDIAVRFLRATFGGWIFCRDNFEECVDVVLAAGPLLGRGHQTWQLNEINALIWPSPNGIGVMDPTAFDRTVQVALEAAIITADPPDTVYTTDLATQALEGLDEVAGDTKGTDFQKQVVEVTEDGA